MRKKILRSLANQIEYELQKKKDVDVKLSENMRSVRDFKTSDPLLKRLVDCYWQQGRESQSQLLQDLFALTVSDQKRNGFFVEFGATNGITLSNTHLLEKSFSWTGILAEPARGWHERLSQARPGSKIIHDCVWKESGAKLNFRETDEGELSSIVEYVGSDGHKKSRDRGYQEYEVTSISLNDLLGRCEAPHEIDFISIDTEGSEFEILNAFDFSNYRFNAMAVEHNFSENEERINQLLEAHYYKRVLKEMSAWDAWYVHQDRYDEIMK
ncbi:FkbM family methyltransferase [Alphaproteobacteria bacterium]|nr:FkbM family methyltransferase [Alphaproteobacteria bacterium]